MQKYEDYEPFDERWSYRYFIGMLTYLARNTRSGIEYVVRQYEHFQSGPRKPRDNDIKRIVRYLIGIKDKGLIIKSTRYLRV